MFSKRKCAYRTCISNWSSDGYSSDPIGSSPAVQVRVRILPDSDAKDYRRWEVMLTNARPFDAAVEMLISFAIAPAPQDWERRGAAWEIGSASERDTQSPYVSISAVVVTLQNNTKH